MESKLPIYGLACPDLFNKKQEFDIQTNEKKCGCTMKKKISAKIIDGATDNPFEAGLVHVYNTNTRKGTTPNNEGLFELEALPDDIINISFVGYKTLTIQASKLPSIIKMYEQDELLDEVIVTNNKKINNDYLYIGLGLTTLLFVYAIAKDSKESKKTYV